MIMWPTAELTSKEGSRLRCLMQSDLETFLGSGHEAGLKPGLGTRSCTAGVKPRHINDISESYCPACE